jgi:hypothetical protein
MVNKPGLTCLVDMVAGFNGQQAWVDKVAYQNKEREKTSSLFQKLTE